MARIVQARDRFKEGQLVQFNAHADEKNVSRKKSRTGVVIRIRDEWIIEVLLDGYKWPQSFHHSFFDPLENV